MTREEAIEWMVFQKEQVLTMSGDKPGTLTVAYDMAIEALQQEEHLVELEAKAVAIIKSERHGEWGKAYRKTANGVDFLVLSCSECDNADPQMNYYNFCPNCGAKMKGADDED